MVYIIKNETTGELIGAYETEQQVTLELQRQYANANEDYKFTIQKVPYKQDRYIGKELDYELTREWIEENNLNETVPPAANSLDFSKNEHYGEIDYNKLETEVQNWYNQLRLHAQENKIPRISYDAVYDMVIENIDEERTGWQY